MLARLESGAFRLRRVLLCVGLILVSSGVQACAGNTTQEDLPRAQESVAKTIQEVLKEHTDEWMAVPAVIGLAVGDCEGEVCIKVLVLEMSPEIARTIPSTAGGFPVQLQLTGEIRARDTTRLPKPDSGG